MTPANHQILNLRKSLLISVGCILSAVIILGGFYLYLSSGRYAQSETLKLGSQLSLQTATLARPLILANDRVSLNYFVNELNKLNHIQGIQIVDQNGILIARAGGSSTLKELRNITAQEKTLGNITLWLNPEPARTLLLQQLWPSLILALSALIFSLLSIFYLCRPKSEEYSTEETPQPSESFSQVLAEQAPHQHNEIPETQNNEEPTTEKDSSSPEGPEAFIIEDTPTAASTQATESDIREQGNPFKTQSLVDLLKPEKSSEPQMPRFEHHPEPDPDSEALIPHEETVVIEEGSLTAPAEETKPAAENPLFKAEREREEVQLDLYSFEHELELILPAMEASYIVYLDSCTANSENANADERAQLLNIYHHFAGQVARIYKGQVELRENGDITICFDVRDEKDNHGINALCAATLFTLLYRGFNQSRIRSFKPILSLQMSLARGNHNRINLVEEEAHFLTRTTQSNELISHTALTEAPILKNSILKDAEIRREDEDKVLILKVTEQHQQLLQKQANHLLTKMFDKR